MADASSNSLDTAVLISTVLEGVLYGFSILMFIGTMWAMTYKRSIRDFNRQSLPQPSCCRSSALFGSNTDLCTYQGVPAAYFADVSRETYLIKNSIYILQTLLGDAVAIYRCYVVWQAAWVIILPSLLWCCVAVTGALSVYGDSQTSSNGIISTQVNVECMGAFCGLTLAANLYEFGITLLATLTPVISIAFYMVIIRIAIGQNTLSQVLTVQWGDDQ
ncbi:hypothetical protein F4604DRAFT_1682979 [Suillus subluteus]|nr:hypothetical protein F4604DRAFT_1682979 [Suillus subluteus]